MIKAIIFDKDDTLIKTRESKFKAFKYVARKFYNFTLSDNDISKYWGKPFDQVITGIFGNRDDLDRIISNFISIRDQFPASAYEGAVKTVRYLLKKGYQVGVVSSSSQRWVESDMKLCKFPYKKFFIMQGAEKTKFHKPDPRVFDPSVEILNKIGIRKNEILSVGDFLLDYIAARDRGLNFIGVVKWGTSKSEFEKAGAKTILNIHELLTIL